MTHNDLKAKLIAEWKASAAYKRIEALESYAHAHGWRAFDGEIIPDFLSRTYDEIARAAGEAGRVEKSRHVKHGINTSVEMDRYPHPEDVTAAIVMGALGMFFGIMGCIAFIAAIAMLH